MKLSINDQKSVSLVKTAVLISIILVIFYIIVLLIFRINSSIMVLTNDILLPILTTITLIILFFAVKRSKTYGKKYYHAWLFIMISQIFWLMMDILWALWDASLINSFVYINASYGFKIVFLSIGIYLLPKPQSSALNKWIVETAIVLVTLTMFFWAFLILPMLKTNQNPDPTVFILNTFLAFLLAYLTSSLLLRYSGNLKKGPILFLIISLILQCIAIIVIGYEMAIGPKIAGFENIFWLLANISLAWAGLLQIKEHPPSVLKDLSSTSFVHQFSLETNVVSLVGLIVYLAALWAYIYNKEFLNIFIYFGGILVVLIIIRSSIDLKSIQNFHRDLKESKETYQSILNTINDAVYIINPKIEFLEINQGALDMYEYSHEELIGKNLEILSAEGKNDLSEVVNMGYRALDGEPQTFEFWGKRKNGEIFPKEIKLNKGTYFGEEVVVAVARDISKRKEVEKKMKKSLEEKELMIQEIHHRVKNNMQVISSLLSLQSMYIEDEVARTAFMEGRSRIQSMAMVHENLYQSESLPYTDVREYINQLVYNLFSMYETDTGLIETKIEVERTKMDMNSAIPFGLILNELLINSLKHAFPNGRGKIKIGLKCSDGCYQLTMADNGVGMPAGFQLDEADGLGLKLVDRLIKQLSGSITLDLSSGTEFRIKFPPNVESR